VLRQTGNPDGSRRTSAVREGGADAVLGGGWRLGRSPRLEPKKLMTRTSHWRWPARYSSTKCHTTLSLWKRNQTASRWSVDDAPCVIAV